MSAPVLERAAAVPVGEAAGLLGMTPGSVLRYRRAGKLAGECRDGVWWIDAESVRRLLEARRQERKVPPRLAAGPLLRQVALRGGDAACGVRHGSAEQKALERARDEGSLTLWAADHLAVQLLGLTAGEVWGDEFWLTA